MELVERVGKLEIGQHDHEGRIKRLEKDNETQQVNINTFHDYIVRTEAKAEGRDRTLKIFMTVLSLIALISPALTILVNYAINHVK